VAQGEQGAWLIAPSPQVNRKEEWEPSRAFYSPTQFPSPRGADLCHQRAGVLR
jgi:hypothetical protein